MTSFKDFPKQNFAPLDPTVETSAKRFVIRPESIAQLANGPVEILASGHDYRWISLDGASVSKFLNLSVRIAHDPTQIFALRPGSWLPVMGQQVELTLPGVQGGGLRGQLIAVQCADITATVLLSDSISPPTPPSAQIVPGDLVYEVAIDVVALAAGSNQTLISSTFLSILQSARFQPMHFRVRMQGGWAHGNTYPLFLRLQETGLVGASDLFFKNWTLPGDGNADIVIPLSRTGFRSDDNAAPQWFLGVYNIAANNAADSCKLLVQLVAGEILPTSRYWLNAKVTKTDTTTALQMAHNGVQESGLPIGTAFYLVQNQATVGALNLNEGVIIDDQDTGGPFITPINTVQQTQIATSAFGVGTIPFAFSKGYLSLAYAAAPTGGTMIVELAR